MINRCHSRAGTHPRRTFIICTHTNGVEESLGFFSERSSCLTHFVSKCHSKTPPPPPKQLFLRSARRCGTAPQTLAHLGSCFATAVWLRRRNISPPASRPTDRPPRPLRNSHRGRKAVLQIKACLEIVLVAPRPPDKAVTVSLSDGLWLCVCARYTHRVIHATVMAFLMA